jgi:hypothetical protein
MYFTTCVLCGEDSRRCDCLERIRTMGHSPYGKVAHVMAAFANARLQAAEYWETKR